MDKIRDEFVIDNLKEFKRKISLKYNIDKIILFGSRARGDNLENSDVDVIVVSSDFNGSIRHRSSEILEYWDTYPDLEVICYTPEEFKRKKKEIGLVQTAVKQGIVI